MPKRMIAYEKWQNSAKNHTELGKASIRPSRHGANCSIKSSELPREMRSQGNLNSTDALRENPGSQIKIIVVGRRPHSWQKRSAELLQALLKINVLISTMALPCQEACYFQRSRFTISARRHPTCQFNSRGQNGLFNADILLAALLVEVKSRSWQGCRKEGKNSH